MKDPPTKFGSKEDDVNDFVIIDNRNTVFRLTSE